MSERDWETITITDNVMFSSVFGSDAGLCGQLLERLLGIPVDHIEYVRREEDVVPELGAKSIRMDVYAADEAGTVFDVEMQGRRWGDIARRSRYYQSANDMDCISPGVPYQGMRDSYVIFVCSYDPFGRGLPVYTYAPACREDGEELDDGSVRLFVSCRSWEKCEEGPLRDLLRYFDKGIIGEGDSFLRDVDDAVRDLRSRREWRERYMRFDVFLSCERADARAEGRAEGLEEGRSEISELCRRLTAAGRTDEFLAAMSDPALLDALLAESGIGDAALASSGV